MTIRFNIAQGAVQALQRSLDNAHYVDAVDIGDHEWALVRQPTIWAVHDRMTVVKTLESFCHGVMDSLGLPRIELPAEYVAAVITTIVDPVNFQIACRWMERGTTVSAESLVEGSIEPIRAQALMVFVIDLYNKEGSAQRRSTMLRKLNQRFSAAESTPLNME